MRKKTDLGSTPSVTGSDDGDPAGEASRAYFELIDKMLHRVAGLSLTAQSRGVGGMAYKVVMDGEVVTVVVGSQEALRGTSGQVILLTWGSEIPFPFQADPRSSLTYFDLSYCVSSRGLSKPALAIREQIRSSGIEMRTFEPNGGGNLLSRMARYWFRRRKRAVDKAASGRDLQAC